MYEAQTSNIELELGALYKIQTSSASTLRHLKLKTTITMTTVSLSVVIILLSVGSKGSLPISFPICVYVPSHIQDYCITTHNYGSCILTSDISPMGKIPEQKVIQTLECYTTCMLHGFNSDILTKTARGQ